MSGSHRIGSGSSIKLPSIPTSGKAPAAQATDVSNYDGPLVLFTTNGVACKDFVVDGHKEGWRPTHLGEVIEKIQAKGIPCALVSTDKSDDTSGLPPIQLIPYADVQAAGGLRGYLGVVNDAFREADTYVIGGNQGSRRHNDVEATADLAHVTTLLRNVDPSHKNMRSELAAKTPVVFDEFFDWHTGPQETFQGFNDALLQQLSNSKSCSRFFGGSPDHKNSLPPVRFQPASPVLEKSRSQLLAQTLGIAQTVGEKTIDVLTPKPELQQLMRQSAAVMAATDRHILGRALDETLRGFHRPTSSQIMQALTAKGTRPGQIDSVISCMNHPHRLDRAMSKPDQEQLTALRSQGQGTPKAGDWVGIQQYSTDLTGAQVRNNVGLDLMIDDSFYDRLIGHIDEATDFIDISTFLFDSDQSGERAIAALTRAAEKGVKINLIDDPYGSATSLGKFETDPKLFDALKKFPNVTFTTTPPSVLDSHLTHRKIYAMDDGHGGQLCMMGDGQFGNDYTVRWHTVNLEVRGPAVTDFIGMELKQGDRFGARPIDEKADGRPDKAGRALLKEMTTLQPGVPGGSTVQVVGHIGKGSQSDHDIKMIDLRAVATAKDDIYLAGPYVSDPDFLKLLVARAQDPNDHVRIHLKVPTHNNHPLLKTAIEAYYKAFEAANEAKPGTVSIEEYDAREMAHDKVLICDTGFGSFRSSNNDARSYTNNDEDALLVYDPAFIQKAIDAIFKAHDSHPILNFHPGPVDAAKEKLTQKFAAVL